MRRERRARDRAARPAHHARAADAARSVSTPGNGTETRTRSGARGRAAAGPRPREARRPYFEVLIVTGAPAPAGRARHRMAPAAPSARRVHLRAGHRRQLRGRLLRGHAQSRPRRRRHPRRLCAPLAARCAGAALARRRGRPQQRERRRLARCSSRRCSSGCGPSSISIWCPTATSRRSPATRGERGAPGLLLGRRAARTASRHPGRRAGRATRRRSSTI